MSQIVEHRDIIWEGKPTNYILTKDGWLINLITHRFSLGSPSNGYWRYQMTIDNKIVTVMKHRLLAQCFVPNSNPEKNTVVHHKDGNPYNNDITNLEWMSQKENSQQHINANLTIKFDYELTPADLEQERWVEYIPKRYAVSNMGRMKNLVTGYITRGSINKNSGYVRWTMGTGSERVERQAHRAVYEAFHPGEALQVINHINGIRNDNRLSNLENISQSENMQAMHYAKGQYNVAQIDENGNIIKMYASASQAEREMQVISNSQATSIGQITTAIIQHRKAYGYYWKRLCNEK